MDLQYTLPRIKQAANEVSDDLPLFILLSSGTKQGSEIL